MVISMLACVCMYCLPRCWAHAAWCQVERRFHLFSTLHAVHSHRSGGASRGAQVRRTQPCCSLSSDPEQTALAHTRSPTLSLTHTRIHTHTLTHTFRPVLAIATPWSHIIFEYSALTGLHKSPKNAVYTESNRCGWPDRSRSRHITHCSHCRLWHLRSQRERRVWRHQNNGPRSVVVWN